jgi:signal transduction histidine kinase
MAGEHCAPTLLLLQHTVQSGQRGLWAILRSDTTLTNYLTGFLGKQLRGKSCFRVVQEGLRNVKKHSGAAQARVHLESVDDALHLSICDDGKGFDMKAVSDGQGLGLWSMQERVRLVGGRFEIHSETLKGTRIEVLAPLKEKADTTRSEVACEPLCAPVVASGQSAG